MSETVLNCSCVFDTMQHSEYYACSQSKEYILSKFQRNKYGRRRMYHIFVANHVTRKHWKFEAVINTALDNPVFWGVQSWSLLGSVQTCRIDLLLSRRYRHFLQNCRQRPNKLYSSKHQNSTLLKNAMSTDSVQATI
jgi:hypothetical protein